MNDTSSQRNPIKLETILRTSDITFRPDQGTVYIPENLRYTTQNYRRHNKNYAKG